MGCKLGGWVQGGGVNLGGCRRVGCKLGGWVGAGCGLVVICRGGL